MEIRENESLGKYTTFGIGGTAQTFYIPQSRAELIELLNKLQKDQKEYYLLGGGSNLLINDQKTFPSVIYLKEFDRTVSIEGTTVCAGASIGLQKFILEINRAGLGGIEYLFSVPGTLGGAICMNAGRGRRYGKCLSDYLQTVTVLDNGILHEYTKEDCKFGYRTSAFKNSNLVILGANFCFEEISEEEGTKRRKERIELCKKEQDNSGRNFGTVFCESNALLMKFIRGIQLGRKGNVQYSAKTLNWLLNKGDGSYEEAITLIMHTERLHKILKQKIEREVIIWK